MKVALLVSLLALGSVPAALAPLASADHCAWYPLVTEAVCEARHVSDPLLDFVLCFYNTAPSQWTRYCLVTTSALP